MTLTLNQLNSFSNLTSALSSNASNVQRGTQGAFSQGRAQVTYVSGSDAYHSLQQDLVDDPNAAQDPKSQANTDAGNFIRDSELEAYNLNGQVPLTDDQKNQLATTIQQGLEGAGLPAADVSIQHILDYFNYPQF